MNNRINFDFWFSYLVVGISIFSYTLFMWKLNGRMWNKKNGDYIQVDGHLN